MDIFTKKAKEAEQQTNRTEKSAGSLDDVFRAISPSALSAVAGITALIGTVKALTGAFETAIGNYAHFEKLQMGLTTFFQDADKGKSKFEELRKLSNETTFGVDELTDAFTQFANVGVEVDSIKDKLIMIGNISQGDKEKFAGLVSIYSKIQSTGKAGAMQLAQIARQGIPIYDTLKKIGVQGTATGEDITKAFQEMTKEGAQFYNAMENINQTIEGKQGFISDYFKEMTVNFAEVTGLADAYKNVLDVLKEVIGNVSDKLLEWNENPVAKAIIQGTLVGVLTLIGTTIVTTIIPALVSVIAKLEIIQALKASINPTGFLISLGVGVVAGLAVGISNLAKSQKELADKTEEATEKLKEQYQQETLLDKLNKAREMRDFYKQKMEEERSGLDELYKQRKSIIEQLEEEKNAYQNAVSVWGKEEDVPVIGYVDENFLSDFGITGYSVPSSVYSPDNSIIVKLQEQVDEFDKKIESSKTTIQNYFKMMNDEAETINTLGVFENNKKTFESLTEEFNALADSVSSDDKKIKDLEKTLQKLNDYKALEGTKILDEKGNLKLVSFNDDEKLEIDRTIDYFQKQLDTLKLKLNPDNSWRTVFSQITGVDLGKGETGLQGGRKVRDKAYEELEKMLEINTLTHGGKKGELNVYENIVSALKEKIEKLMTAEGVDDPFKATDESIKMLSNELLVFQGKANALKKELEDTKEPIEEITKSWRELIDEQLRGSENYKDIAKYSLQGNAYDTIQGTDVGEYLKLMENGSDWIGALIQVAVKDLIDFCGGLEKVQFLLDIVKNVIDALSPALEFILNIVTIIGWILKPILTMLKNMLNFIFGDLNEAMDKLYNSIEDETEARKQSTKDLTSEYEKLLKVLKEQEEYYLRKRTELNAWTLKDYVQNARPVNDMILTPHGNFSTHPNDTIIATKNPESLGGANVKVTINNYSDTNVNVQQKKNADGMNELLVTISRKIASDVAGGYNGWDSAFAMQQQRIGGRRI